MENTLYHLQQQKNSRLTYLITLMLSALSLNVAWAADITVSVTDGTGAPVENAIVYAEPLDAKALPPAKPGLIIQKNRTINPLVSVVQTGASISFPNQDMVRHHLYSFSPAKTFEIKLYANVPPNPILFDKPGTVVLGCNIHDFMIGFIQVVDTPYFAKTDASGTAKITDLPTGSYNLKTWHYALAKENAVVEQAVSVKGSDRASVKLELKPFPLPKRPA